MTRSEFAAGLNAAIERVNELLRLVVERVSRDDLATLRRLQGRVCGRSGKFAEPSRTWNLGRVKLISSPPLPSLQVNSP